jgi:hypothetical protein
MKNIFLAFVFALFCGTAFAGSCETGSCTLATNRPVTSATVNVGRRVVQAPARLFRGVRAGVSARQCRRSAVRASRSTSCVSCG